MQALKRKADTRSKIQMGGLVKKAGLEDLHKINPMAILGALLEIKEKIDRDQNLIGQYEKLGREFGKISDL